MPALNLKNEEAYRLVKELAELRGTSMTEVVIEIARKELEQERRARQPKIDHERMQYFLDLGQRVRASLGPTPTAREMVDELYDEDGLPT